TPHLRHHPGEATQVRPAGCRPCQRSDVLSASSVNNLRVLFVDDEAPIRTVMQAELPRMGHDVTICEDGAAALQALENNSFDAAIIDLRMPGLSGWDVIEHMQQVAPQTDIIISTGH